MWRPAGWYPIDDPGCADLEQYWDGAGWLNRWRPIGVAEGWYGDPHDPSVLRRWTGKGWTDDTMPRPSSEAEARALEEQERVIPLLTLQYLPGAPDLEVLDFVSAAVVMSRNLVSDFGSDVSSVFGGKLGGIEKAIDAAISEARHKLNQRAKALGAEAVIGLSVGLENVADKAQAILLSGTAVRPREISDRPEPL